MKLSDSMLMNSNDLNNINYDSYEMTLTKK